MMYDYAYGLDVGEVIDGIAIPAYARAQRRV
jgi:hypothetical protein